MKFESIVKSCLVGGLFLLVSCDHQGRNTTKLQYMPDMADNPTVKAQENYLDPPEHSVPATGVLYPSTFEEAEKELKNQAKGPRSEVLAKGKIHFETYCSVCHGKDGKGAGTMGASYPLAVPDISRADLAARADGFYFMKISKGGPMMPSYGHAISRDERWEIVTYLRTLQK